MGRTLDPITGIPSIDSDLSGIVEQVPLGAQTFPWDDFDATSRPNRAVSYPDDILPTTALVAGQYHKAAQAVNTDGNHALCVHVTNQSSGGSGSFVVTESGGDTSMGNISGSTVYGGSFGFLSTDPFRIITIEVQPDIISTAPSVYSKWTVGLSNNGADPNIVLFQGSFHTSAWKTYPYPFSRWTLSGGILDWEGSGLTPNLGCFYLSTTDGACLAAISYVMGH